MGDPHLYHLLDAAGVDWSAAVVDALVIGAVLGALVVSVVLNVRDMRRAGSAGRDG